MSDPITERTTPPRPIHRLGRRIVQEHSVGEFLDQARVRVLVDDGTPAPGCEVSLLLLAERDGVEHRQPADWFDPVNHGERHFTDEEGRAELPALIPGARYIVRAALPGQRALSDPFTAVSAKPVPVPELRLPPVMRTTK